MKSALARLQAKAAHIRAVNRAEVLNTSTEGFTWRDILALDELIAQLGADQCHDGNCQVHFKGPSPAGDSDRG